MSFWKSKLPKVKTNVDVNIKVRSRDGKELPADPKTLHALLDQTPQIAVEHPDVYELLEAIERGETGDELYDDVARFLEQQKE